jgi:hydrogenase-4 component B
LVFRAREQVEMPSPGDTRPAKIKVVLRDLVWEYGYQPIVTVVSFAADRLNCLQFQTIRRYLSFVFFTLITLLLLLTLWT